MGQQDPGREEAPTGSYELGVETELNVANLTFQLMMFFFNFNFYVLLI